MRIKVKEENSGKLPCEYAIVVAYDERRGIGRSGEIPWHLPGDLRHFAELTRQTENLEKKNAVIMGRVTWESLPDRARPLAGRINIVLARSHNVPLPNGVAACASLKEALALAQEEAERIFVIGGEAVYWEALKRPECRWVYATEVEGNFACDRFFPSLPSSFSAVSVSGRHEEGGVGYRFVTYERR